MPTDIIDKPWYSIWRGHIRRGIVLTILGGIVMATVRRGVSSRSATQTRVPWILSVMRYRPVLLISASVRMLLSLRYESRAGILKTLIITLHLQRRTGYILSVSSYATRPEIILIVIATGTVWWISSTSSPKKHYLTTVTCLIVSAGGVGLSYIPRLQTNISLGVIQSGLPLVVTLSPDQTTGTITIDTRGRTSVYQIGDTLPSYITLPAESQIITIRDVAGSGLLIHHTDTQSARLVNGTTTLAAVNWSTGGRDATYRHYLRSRVSSAYGYWLDQPGVDQIMFWGSLIRSVWDDDASTQRSRIIHYWYIMGRRHEDRYDRLISDQYARYDSDPQWSQRGIDDDAGGFQLPEISRQDAMRMVLE